MINVEIMLPSVINGAPTHALVVHAVVVLLPMALLAALVLVVVPAARKAFSLLTLFIGFIACVAVPLAFVTGGDLRSRVGNSPLIDAHVSAAHLLLPVAAVFGVALAAFVAADVMRRAGSGDLNRVEAAAIALAPTLVRNPGRVASRAVAAVLVVMSIATGIAVVRVGDTGARAVWAGRLSSAGQ